MKEWIKDHVFGILYSVIVIPMIVFLIFTQSKYEIRYQVKLINNEKIYDVSEYQMDEKVYKNDRVSVVIEGRRYMQEQIEWYSSYTIERDREAK